MINYNLKPLFENDLRMVYNLFRPRIEHRNKDAEEVEIEKKRCKKKEPMQPKEINQKVNYFNKKYNFFKPQAIICCDEHLKCLCYSSK